MIYSVLDFVYNVRQGPKFMLLLPWYLVSAPFVEEPNYAALDCLSEMNDPWLSGFICGWSLLLHGQEHTVWITVTQSYVLKLGRESTNFVLFLIGYSVLLAFPYERGTIYLCEKARWELVGNPVESMGVLPVCGPEWAHLFRSVLFCNEKLAVFRVQLLYFSCSTCIPKYFIFLDAILVLFLFGY